MHTVDELRIELERLVDPERAAGARRYMRDRFEFLGIPMPTLRRTAKPLVRTARTAPADRILDIADELWAQPEREFQYVGVDLLRAGLPRLGRDHLDRIERYVRTASWWDTVDALAAHVVGGLVAADRDRLAPHMDLWIDDPDLWIARTAILHQLRYGADTDVDRLFGYVDRRCDDTEFFIRKACGWALRQYARHDPDEVGAYVTDRGNRLSPLTRREATKHLEAFS